MDKTTFTQVTYILRHTDNGLFLDEGQQKLLEVCIDGKDMTGMDFLSLDELYAKTQKDEGQNLINQFLKRRREEVEE